MTLLFRRATIWTALNLIGMAIYLRLASDLWTVPGDEGLPGGPGDPFYWFFFLIPILLAYLAFNLVALSAIVKRVGHTRKFTPLYIWVVIAMLWVVTFRYDHLRSFRVISPPATNYSALIVGTRVASIVASQAGS
jgi:hypothetical protein